MTEYTDDSKCLTCDAEVPYPEIQCLACQLEAERKMHRDLAERYRRLEDAIGDASGADGLTAAQCERLINRPRPDEEAAQ